MRFPHDSVTGKRLRQHGISSRALDRTRVFGVIWPPFTGFVVPLPFLGPAIIIGRRYLDRELDGQLADSPDLAYLVHQYCHALQKLEWGAIKYVWRHVWSRLISKGVETHRLQVEREAHLATRAASEFYGVGLEMEQDSEQQEQSEVSV